jgi:uroporphyrinogen decarboxylase
VIKMSIKPNFDRLLKVVRREQPDRVPLYEHIVDSYIMEAILKKPTPPMSHPKDPYKAKKRYMAFIYEFFKGLGYDYVPLEIGLRLFRLNSQVSTRKEPLGRESRGWVDDSRATIANKEEFEEYPWPAAEEAIDFELLKAAKEMLPEGMKLVSGVAGGVYEHTIQLIGMKQFSRSLRKDTGFLRQMFDTVGKLIGDVDKIIAEEDHVGILRMGDDLGFKTATMLSPKHLREYVFPWQKYAVDIAHKQDKPFILHSCGNIKEVIDDLIDYVGIDAWHSFQDIILPVPKAKEKFGERVAILGGVDLDILSRVSLEECKIYCKDVLAKCMPNGGYAFGSGNSIPNYVKLDNYLAMLDIGKKFGKYV